MSLSESLARVIRRNFSLRKNSKATKTNRSVAPMLIAAVALLAAVVFSVSVESRRSGSLPKAQTSTPPISPEVAKNSTPPSADSNPNRSVGTNRALALFAPTVTATKTDSLFTDVDGDIKADPGDTLKYTVVIGATGEDATGVTFTDTVDPNTAFVAGSLRTTPLARNDSYSASGNIRIQVPAPGVLANDQDFDAVGGAISVTAGTFLSAQNGNVTINADGSFSYNPAPGFEGSDSFTYTLNDNDTPNNTDTATVSITVSGMIWFINNNAAACLTLAAGCGRLTNPFSTLAAFNALNNGTGNNPAANDNIFVYESATPYVGPLTLLNGQKFIGQDATATLSSISGVTPPANSDPLPATSPGAPIVNITSAGIGITVAQNNILRGYTGGDAGTDINGTGFATLNISDVTLNGNGQTLALATGTLTGVFGSLSSTNSATTGLTLTSVAGTLTTGSTTVTNPTGIGISVGTSSAVLSFADTSVSGSGGTGVSLLTNTGGITFGDLDISPDANQKGLLATNNTQTITATSGTLATTGAAAVEITRAGGLTPLNVSLTSVSTNGGPNGIILSGTSGSFTVTGNAGVCTEASPATCSGGQILNINTGADTDPVAALPPGTGIALRNATNVSLTRIRINNTNNYGIHGLNVNNFTMANSVIHGVNGTNVASPFRDSSMRFDQLTGTNSITNSLISGGFQHNLLIDNQSGSSQITVSGNTIKTTNAATGDDGFQLEAETTAVVNAFVTNNSFSVHGGDHFNLSLINSADVDLTFTGNAFAGGHAVGLGQGLFILGANFNGTFNYDISNNGTALAPLTGNKQGGMIHVNKGSGTGTFNGRIQNNFIGNAAIVKSGSEQAFGIYASARGAGGSHTTLINSNTVRQYFDTGIVTQAGEGAAAFNATVTNNTVDNFADAVNSLHGIFSDNGILAADTNAVCLDMQDNLVANAGNEAVGGADIRLRKGSQVGLSVRIPGLVGTTATDADNKITAENPNATTVTVTGANYSGGAACTQPTLPAAPLGPIEASTSSELSAKSAQESESSVKDQENVLWAARGENKDPQHVVSLTQSEVSAMVEAAIARWSETGLSANDFALLQSFSYKIADLPEGQLATLKGNQITLDTTAAGYGWFFDTTPSDDKEFDVPVPNQELQTTEYSGAHGRVDLLTVLMRQLGSTLKQSKSKLQGPQSWLMENTLEPGTRRAPTFKIEIGKVSTPKASDAIAASKSNTAKQLNRDTSYEQVASVKRPRNSRVTRNHAMRAAPPTPFEDVMLAIGVLPAGKTITITFNVTVDNPYLGATNQVSNQGTVSGSNFANVLTDDPDVAGAANPTVTTIDQPDVTVAVSPASVLEDGSDNLVYTFTREGSTAANLTVNFSVGGTATFSTDYTQIGAATFNATSGTVTIPIGSSTATVTLDPTTDTTVELDETAILTVVSGASYDVGTPSQATGTITNDDTDVTVAVSPSSVEEDGVANLVYTFTRNGVTSGPLTVNFSVGGTAVFTNDATTDYTQIGAASFTPTTGTVTFGAGNTTATVTVDPSADNAVEPNETVIMTLTAGTGYNVAIPSTATGTITNDDAEVTLAVSPSSVDEDGVPNLVYTFTRTGDTTGALVVNFTIGGTADGTDYTQTGATSFTPPNGTVTFGAGNSTATVTVDPTADATAEANETVIFTLAAGADYNIGTPSAATGTINNDDTSVSVAVSPAAADEDGATNLVYTFTRSDSSGALTVNFSIGGTATFSGDYTQMGAATFTPPTGTVTFADGSLTAIVTVDPLTDSTVEPDETVTLTVTAGAGYTVGAPASASGTITNDDTDVTVAVSPLSTSEDGATNLVYTFTRTGVTTGALTANFSVNGTADGTDYTQSGAASFTPPTGTVDFIAGGSTATVTIDPTADNTSEPDETVILTVTAGTGYNVGVPSAATGTITNDDAVVTVAVSPSAVDEDGATNLAYTFTRTGFTGAALTVNFSIGGTADGTDYTQSGAASFTPPTGTVTFGAGNSTASVTIDPSVDATSEPDETVILTVTPGTGYEVGAPDSATGTINNDDNAVSVAVSPGAVNEDGATNLVYTFTRGDSSGALTVNFSIGGTATFSGDYTQMDAATFVPPNGTVTFADGSLTATVTVDPSTDTTVEPDETVILTVTAGAGYTVGVPASASGTITNDDTDVTVAVSPLSTTEDGAGNLVYTFTRTGVTTGPLTANFSVGGTANGTDYTQSGAASFTPPTGTVTFIAGSSTATVTVDPTADGAAEADETVILTVTAGTGYNVAAPSVATGTITNDDTEVSVAVSPSSALEDGATNMVYTFTRTGIISGALTVNFSVGGTAIFAPPDTDYTVIPVAGDTFTATSGTVNFTAGSSTATVTVDPFGDADLEPDETVILTVTAGAGYTVGAPSSATGTILNDDNSPPTVVVGYGQCGGGTSTGTLSLLVGDVETPAGSLILSATSSNTAVVPLGNISFGGSGANRTVTINAVAQATVAFSDVTITVSDGTFTSSINIRVIVGTNKTETINIGTTTVGTDMIFGGNGDDTINSGAGNDLICGGNGGGAVNGGLGDDTIDGGNGNDTLRGGDGNDRILGGGGNDTLEGGNNNDTLDGGGGTDTLRGESGDDTLTGGSGPDSFNGGPGNDTATDFNLGQGDTKDISVEIAAAFAVEDGSRMFAAASGVSEENSVFAYLASVIPWWVSSILGGV